MHSKIIGLGVVRGVSGATRASCFRPCALGCFSCKTSETVSPEGSLSFSLKTPLELSMWSSSLKAGLHFPWKFSFAMDLEMVILFLEGIWMMLIALLDNPCLDGFTLC